MSITNDIRWIQRLDNYEKSVKRLDTEIQGSRDAIRKALAMGLVSDSAWMDTIASRNITSHYYDEIAFNAVYSKIMDVYFPLFKEFCNVMNEKRGI